MNGVALLADDDGGPASCDHIGGGVACITNSGTRMRVYRETRSIPCVAAAASRWRGAGS